MPHLLPTRLHSEYSNDSAGLKDKKLVEFAENSPFSWWLRDGQSKLPPEIERDNVEYKWKLTGMTEERRVHLVTQMRWRVGELGYCWYILGVKDNGDLEGISAEDLQATLQVLEDLVHRANLSIKLIQPVGIKNQQTFICQVRIELDGFGSQDACLGEGRVLFLGAAGSGKTTLLSVLGDWGKRDDGRGKMRTRLLHHRHELLTGTTSSITHQPLVFLPNQTAEPLNVNDEEVMLNLEQRREILGRAKVLQLIDSAGKLRFNRTVFSVLTAAAHPLNLALIVIEAPIPQAATNNPPNSTVETFRLLQALGVPTALLINKIDQSCTETISQLLEELSTQFHDRNLVIWEDDATGESDSQDFPSIPVLLSSTVTGDFLLTLCKFLYSHTHKHTVTPGYNYFYAQESATSALIIEQVANLVEIGMVVYGQVAFGTIWTGDEMILGPVDRGCENLRVTVQSIQRLKCPVNSATQTQHISIALQFQNNPTTTTTTTIRKGMTLLKLKESSANFTLKPLKRIIAEMEPISLGATMQQRFTGVIFVMGQRFPATLDIQPRAMRRPSSQSRSTTPIPSTQDSPASSTCVCLVTFNEKRPANVFLFPLAPIIFIGSGRKEKFVGKVINYFA